MQNRWISWNENIKHDYQNIYYPESETEIADIVRQSASVRMIGTGKSSADIAAGTDTLISPGKYNKILNIDRENLEITVQSGLLLKKMIQEMEKNELAFPALPDIDDITVGGAIATGTHGTGKKAQSLSSYIKKIKIVNAEGEIEKIEASDSRFHALQVSMGVLGIFTEITFYCIPKKTMNIVERPMHDNDWLSNYRAMLTDNDFLRILWLPHTNHGYVITGNYTDKENLITAKNGPWYYKYRRKLSKFLYGLSVKRPQLTAFANKIIYRLFFSNRQQKNGSLYDATVTKSRGSTLELAEWTVAIDKFDDLFKELKAALDSKSNDGYAHIPMDVRFLSAENGWLSNAYGKDIVTMGCVTRNAGNADNYEAFNVVEKIFLKYDGRPHWAKRFQAGSKTLKSLYPKWDEFLALRKKMDKTGKFLNSYLGKILK